MVRMAPSNMTKDLRWSRVQARDVHVLVSLCTAEPIPNSVWGLHLDGVDEWLTEVARNQADYVGLTVAEGYGPNASQRLKWQEMQKKHPPRPEGTRISLITDGVLMRGVATALGWFGRADFRAYSPANWRDAFSYMQLDRDQTKQVLEAAFACYEGMSQIKSMEVMRQSALPYL
jgi:hypothetical protein